MTMRPDRDPSCVLAFDFTEPSGDTVYDLSGHGNHGTIHGATRIGHHAWQGLYFDGVDDYVEVSPSPIVDMRSVSVEMLVYLSSDNYKKDVLLLISGQSRYNIYIEKYSTERFAFIVIGTDGHSYGASFGTEVYYDRWIHIGGVADEGDEVRTYLNAELTDSVTFSVGVRDAVGNLELMQDHQYSRRCKGLIALVRIYNRALSEREIREHYYYFMKLVGRQRVRPWFTRG